MGLLVGRTRLAVSSVGLSSRCWARVRLLVNGEHCLATGEPLLHHADLVDGLGRWRLGLDCWCWIVPRAESASASSSASPSSTATPSSGRLLLLLLCGLGWAALLRAETLGVSRVKPTSIIHFYRHDFISTFCHRPVCKRRHSKRVRRSSGFSHVQIFKEAATI